MLIFTKGVLEPFSTEFETLLGATSGESEAGFEAIFFLNDRSGGHPTTEAGAVLFFASLTKG